ncbi:MAG: hypothetical protein ACPH8E_08165, partial [Flavobacteriales bacterium]
SQSARVYSWSAGETFSFNYDGRLREPWSVAMAFTQIGTFSRLSICAGPQVRLSPHVSAQVRMGGLAQRWLLTEDVRGTTRPNLHVSLRGEGKDGKAVILGMSFVPEGRLPRVQAREELMIRLQGVAERKEQKVQAQCTWTSAGVALEWQWLARLDAHSQVGLNWRMLPGFVGVLGSREFELYRLSFGVLYGLRYQGMCLALGMEAC